MHEHFPEGFEMRYPGRKKASIVRKALEALGPFHQISSDGHEKVAELALQMGSGVGIGIYGHKDKWTDFIVSLSALPENRSAVAIGHHHLDVMEKIGGMLLLVR